METRQTTTIRAKTNSGLHTKKSNTLKFNLTAEEFLIDLIPLIKENLSEVKKEEKDDYNNGRVFAYFDVLSLIQSQAQNFGLDLKELNLENDVTLELFY